MAETENAGPEVAEQLATPFFDELVAAHPGLVTTYPKPALPITPAARTVTTVALARGIDTARYQGSPDWRAVAGAGIQFTYVKASEGASTSYPTLDDQYRGARAAALAVGLYHYARPNQSAEVNADALARQVNRLGAAAAGHLPPCLDLEEGTGDLSGWAQRFIARLRAQTGCQRVAVYSGASFFRTQIGEGWMDDDVILWIAHYGRNPGQPGYLTPRVGIHQYSQTGRVAGISGDVDLNQTLRPLSELLIGGEQRTAAQPPPQTSGEEDAVILAVPYFLPAGTGMKVPLIVPPYQGVARFRLVTGWENADIHAVYFVRDAGPNLTPNQEQWGGTGPWTLVHDDRPWWDLPSGTTQVSLEYSAPFPLGAMTTYRPAADP